MTQAEFAEKYGINQGIVSTSLAEAKTPFLAKEGRVKEYDEKDMVEAVKEHFKAVSDEYLKKADLYRDKVASINLKYEMSVCKEALK